MKTKSHAYIEIEFSGASFNPTTFSSLCGVEATILGESRLGEKYWQHKIEAKDENEGISDALSKLVQLFSPKIDVIRKEIDGNDLYVKVFVVIHNKTGSDAGTLLDRSFLNFAELIKAEIEVDFYSY